MAKTTTRTKEQLKAEIATLHEELDALELAEAEPRLRGLVGRCFKYRNCYSGPEKPSDYWWVYAMVTEIYDGTPYALRFETDKDGRVTVTPRDHFVAMVDPTERGYVEISRGEFDVAWQAAMLHLAVMKRDADTTACHEAPRDA